MPMALQYMGLCSSLLWISFTQGQGAQLQVSPLFGPVAGGTELLIKGGDLQAKRVAEVSLGDHGIVCKIIRRSRTSLVVRTPEVSRYMTGSSLPVIIYIDSVETIFSGHTFQYRPNPVIEVTYPLKTIYRGGITQHVTGSHLDSVAEPIMEITMLFENETHTNQETFLGECDPYSPDNMKCWTPSFELPVELLESLPEKEEEADSPDVTFKVNFRMDGINADNNDTLRVFNSLPVLEANPDVVQYRLGSNASLLIRGRRLEVGVSVDDYCVTIVSTNSSALRLYSTSLFHTPPQAEPLSMSGGDHGLGITVSIGRHLRYHVGGIRYVRDPMALIVACVVAGLLLLAILLAAMVIALVRIRRRREARKPSGTTRRDLEGSTHGEKDNPQANGTADPDSDIIPLPKVEDMFQEERYVET